MNWDVFTLDVSTNPAAPASKHPPRHHLRTDRNHSTGLVLQVPCRSGHGEPPRVTREGQSGAHFSIISSRPRSVRSAFPPLRSPPPPPLLSPSPSEGECSCSSLLPLPCPTLRSAAVSRSPHLARRGASRALSAHAPGGRRVPSRPPPAEHGTTSGGFFFSSPRPSSCSSPLAGRRGAKRRSARAWIDFFVRW